MRTKQILKSILSEKKSAAKKYIKEELFLRSNLIVDYFKESYANEIMDTSTEEVDS